MARTEILVFRRGKIYVTIVLVLAVVLSACHGSEKCARTGDVQSIQRHLESILSDTSPAKHLSALIAAVNSAELGQMQSFAHTDLDTARAKISEAELTRQITTLYREARALDVYRVENSDASEIVAQVRSPLTEQFYRIAIGVAADPPYGIISFRRLMMTVPPEVAAHPRWSDQEIARELDSYLGKLVAADVFSGTVLVAKDETPIFAQAYGMADRDQMIPNRLETQFNLASVIKVFTGVAIAQLAEQRKLAYNDTIKEYLPEYPNQSVAKRVTIHQLLTHTSGLGNFLGPRFEASKDKLRLPQDYFPLFADDPLSFEPGTGVQYSNAGFIVLQAIVEKVTGLTFFEYLHDHVFEPAGMKNTASFRKNEIFHNRAVGYTYVQMLNRQSDLCTRTNNLSALPYSDTGSGGGYSTVADLLLFTIALRDHKLLSVTDTDLVTSGKVETRAGPETRHAYGFEDDLVNQHRIVGHGGGFTGVNTQFDYYPNDRYTVIVLSNYDPLAATVVANKLRTILTTN